MLPIGSLYSLFPVEVNNGSGHISTTLGPIVRDVGRSHKVFVH